MASLSTGNRRGTMGGTMGGTKNSNLPVLSAQQSRCCQLYYNDFKTVKQIAEMLNISKWAVYKHLRNLKNKGYFPQEIDGVQKGGVARGVGSFPVEHSIRAHAFRYSVRIINRVNNKYQSLLKSCNQLFVMDSTVMLYDDSIQIFSLTSFTGRTVSDAAASASVYLTRLLRRLEHDLGLTLLKDRYQNIRLVGSHFAEVGNELARSVEVGDDRIMVRGVDGKVWLLVDNSHSFWELETVSAQRSKVDMEDVVVPFFNDLRRNPSTLSEIRGLIRDVVRLNGETAAGLNAIVELSRPVKYDVVVGGVRPDYVS